MKQNTQILTSLIMVAVGSGVGFYIANNVILAEMWLHHDEVIRARGIEVNERDSLTATLQHIKDSGDPRFDEIFSEAYKIQHAGWLNAVSTLIASVSISATPLCIVLLKRYYEK